ncbi:hypothetical protein XELAEV_18018328mg [Xenopus laevis]|uniref:Uncharacterized protein n=1 Tax=Xenopus laevis TaxID=8355 RepID=A0A974DCS0_XENLA|nr:hypothetical protein XELAEV_18018328mg [Xenopus laevis]
MEKGGEGGKGRMNIMTVKKQGKWRKAKTGDVLLVYVQAGVVRIRTRGVRRENMRVKASGIVYPVTYKWCCMRDSKRGWKEIL